MSVKTTTYDVFLSYSLTEAKSAELVERALTEAGLDVFTPDKVESGADLSEVLWRALAESVALVAVIHPERVPMSNITVELGAAMAWHKSIYIVRTENGSAKAPDYLQEFPIYPISRVDDVVHSIRNALKPLSKRQLAALRSAYLDLGIPTDKLLRDPASIDVLARQFNRRCSAHVPGERLVLELVRLRKAGNLPRLAKKAAPG